ncbi:MAG TPA: hypothetical protein VIJ49_07980, partial [Aestuariivirga sp.]
YGISWLASSWSHFTSQITMHYGSGSNVSPSTSMELYEINLRRMQVDTDRKETGRILEWKLAVPRAFLIDEIGKNGTPYTEKNSDATAYGVDLAMQASEDLKSFVPKTLVTEKGKIPRDIIIGFSNNLTDSKGTSIGFIVENDLCVRAEDEQQEAAKLHEHGYSGWCHDEDYRCLISAQLDGWGIGFNVTKDLYSRPLEACAMTKDFLNKYTIKRDDGHTVAKGATP